MSLPTDGLTDEQDRGLRPPTLSAPWWYETKSQPCECRYNVTVTDRHPTPNQSVYRKVRCLTCGREWCEFIG